MELCLLFIHWYNEDEILQLLQQLPNLRCSHQVVIVDNQGGLQLDHPDVDIIRVEENVGFAQACNLALDWAIAHQADYLLLANTDISCDFSALATLVDAQHTQQLVAMSPLIVETLAGKEKINYGGRDPVKYLDSRIEDESQLDQLMYLPGTFLVLDVQAVMQLGHLDARFFFSGEIADLFYRINHAGLSYAIYHEMQVIHHVNERKAANQKLYVYYSIRNRYLLIERNYKTDRTHWIKVWNKRIFRQKLGALLRFDWAQFSILNQAQRDGLQHHFGPYRAR